MGWTSCMATHYTDGGKIDRKAECDALYTEDGANGKWEVLKSTIVGSVYYCACKRTRPGEDPYVFAGICLTSLEKDGCFDFGYKDMSENYGPYNYDCPASILNLLSPTTDKYALEWRQKCRENIARKAAERKDKNSLQNLPVGAAIHMNTEGGRLRLVKDYGGNFKRPKWIDWNTRTYYPESYIKTKGYTVA